MLATYDVTWFEEALPPDDLAGFAELRRHSPVPIATGEVFARRQSFRPLFEQQCVDIVQPDCTKCGGLTEAWRITWSAYEHNVREVASVLERDDPVELSLGLTGAALGPLGLTPPGASRGRVGAVRRAGQGGPPAGRQVLDLRRRA